MTENKTKTLSDIAGIVTSLVGPNGDRSLLYAEADDGYVSTSIFKDEGDFVQFISADNALSVRILDLWYAASASKKWAALLLTIEDDQFQARFQYADEWGDDDIIERRNKVIAAKYGNKQVRYPPIDMD